MPKFYVCHSKYVLNLAVLHGWFVGARYTNLRDTRDIGRIDFLDIDWKRYNFDKHLSIAKTHRPTLTIAQDLQSAADYKRTITQALKLKEYCTDVAIVPKLPKYEQHIIKKIPRELLLGYSVPSTYGGTNVPIKCFKGHKIHLLGGRP